MPVKKASLYMLVKTGQLTWEVGEATLAAGLPPASGLCTGVADDLPAGLKALCA
jgi:hypothetical protein